MGCALSPLGPLDSRMESEPRMQRSAPASIPIERGLAAQRPLLADDIYLGMALDGVRASWGRPAEVQFASHPSQGVQRWIYIKEIPSPDGYLKERRIVYFENQRVVGWETEGL